MPGSGEGNGTLLQYSCLENPMVGGAWWAAAHGVAKCRTRLSNFTLTFHFNFSLPCIGEGNGNPLQCSCLENPRDEGAWWDAVSGVAQNRTWLKRLSSSNSSSILESWSGRFANAWLFLLNSYLYFSLCLKIPNFSVLYIWPYISSWKYTHQHEDIADWKCK